MNAKTQMELAKRLLGNHQLKYVLRQYKNLNTEVMRLRKVREEGGVDEEAAQYYLQTGQITFDQYCASQRVYSKELMEMLGRHNSMISKHNLLLLYKIDSSVSSNGAKTQRFNYLLLQKLSEHIGDMNMFEITMCIQQLKQYDEKVAKFQFDLISDRILELIDGITTEQLVQILHIIGKFDQGTEKLWNTMTKLFLFRMDSLSKDQVLYVIKGFAAANRGNDIFWTTITNYVLSHYNNTTKHEKNQDQLQDDKRKLEQATDFDFIWILMKTKVDSNEFWMHMNKEYSYYLAFSMTSSKLFYKFFKYSVCNITLIHPVNKIALIDALLEQKQHFDYKQDMKFLDILQKNHLLTPKIRDAFQKDSLEIYNIPIKNYLF